MSEAWLTEMGFHKANLKMLFSLLVVNCSLTGGSASCNKFWACKFFCLSFSSELFFKSHFSALERAHISTQECIQKQVSSWSLFTSEHNEWALAANARCIHRIRLELVQSKLSWKWHCDGWGILNTDRFALQFCSSYARVHKCECTAIVSSRMVLYLHR